MHKNISEGAPRKSILELKHGHPIENTPSLEPNYLLHGGSNCEYCREVLLQCHPSKNISNKNDQTFIHAGGVFFGGCMWSVDFFESSLTLEGGAQDIGEHIAFLNKRLLRTKKPALLRDTGGS